MEQTRRSLVRSPPRTKKARVFAPEQALYRLVSVGKAWSLPTEQSITRPFTWFGSALTYKYRANLKKHKMGKHSSLLYSTGEDGDSFITTTLRRTVPTPFQWRILQKPFQNVIPTFESKSQCVCQFRKILSEPNITPWQPCAVILWNNKLVRLSLTDQAVAN